MQLSSGGDVFDEVSECPPGWKEMVNEERKEQFPPKYPLPLEHQHSVCISLHSSLSFFLEEVGRFAICTAVLIYGLFFFSFKSWQYIF